MSEALAEPPVAAAGRTRVPLSEVERRRLREHWRPMKSWERYKALLDLVEEQFHLLKRADQKGRFALALLGPLNAFLFVIAQQTSAAAAVPEGARLVFTVFLAAYVCLTISLFVIAVEALRPRDGVPNEREVRHLRGGRPGLRVLEDVLDRDVDAYREAWRQPQIDALNDELSAHAWALASVNRRKFVQLDRLYRGLTLAAIMAAVMLLGGMAFVLHGKAQRLEKLPGHHHRIV